MGLHKLGLALGTQNTWETFGPLYIIFTYNESFIYGPCVQWANCAPDVLIWDTEEHLGH